MQEFDFLTARSIKDLGQLLSDPGGRLIAGGTDIIPQIQMGTAHPSRLIDIGRIQELRFTKENDGWIHIGACSTFEDILNSPILQDAAPSLIQTANHTASPMIRARGTVGGNIGNASPAADTLPSLLTLDASISIFSQRGERELPLDKLLIGPYETALFPDEAIRQVSFRKPVKPLGFSFLKLGARQGFTISIVTVAIMISLDASGLIDTARIAFGAVAPKAMRCPKTEAMLPGQKPGNILWLKASEMVMDEISPIDDIRASKYYRRKAAGILLVRALNAATEMAKRRVFK